MRRIQVGDGGQGIYVKQLFTRERRRPFLSLLLCPWPGNCPEARGVLSQIRAMFRVKGRGRELNAPTLLYVHHLCNTQTTT